MSSIRSNQFEINGVISTDKSVISNINDLATAAGAWMTYDISQGKYAVVINTTGSSIASFDDSNIIGGINVSGTGINELYNKVSIEFPHKDLNDERDYIDLEIPSADRLPNELDNKLSIYTDLVNDPVQAQYIAQVELKQTRLDKIIEFRTDYSKIGLKAGDLIDVTNDTYGYTNKMFRIVKIQEDDGDVLAISITALEYDADIYDDSNLERRFRERATGIIPANINDAVVTSDVKAVALDNIDGTPQVLTPAVISSGNAAINLFLQTAALATAEGFSQNNPGTSLATFKSNVIIVSTSAIDTFFNNWSGTAGYRAPTSPTDPGAIGPQNQGGGPALNVNFTLTSDYSTFVMLMNPPLASMYMYPLINTYNIAVRSDLSLTYIEDVTTQVNRRTFTGYIPMEVNLYYVPNPLIPTYVPVGQIYTDWQAQTAVFTVENMIAGAYTISFQPEITYDLSQDDQFGVYHNNYSVIPQSSGGGLTVTTLGFKEN